MTNVAPFESQSSMRALPASSIALQVNEIFLMMQEAPGILRKIL
jgi:hypothetical protein